MTSTNAQEALRRIFTQAIPHVRELGITVNSITPDATVVRLPYRSDWLGDIERGLIHTGVISTLVDTASGLAVFAKLATFEPIATLDLRMDYLRVALRDKDLHCRAECYRVTSHIAFVRATAWQNDEQTPVAISQSVFMRSSQGKQRAARSP